MESQVRIAAQHSLHPNPSKVRWGRGGMRRVFQQCLGLKPVPAKLRCLVPPGCRLAKPCRDTPAGTHRVLRKRTPLGGVTRDNIVQQRDHRENIFRQIVVQS
jgi:hypothetical protein